MTETGTYAVVHINTDSVPAQYPTAVTVIDSGLTAQSARYAADRLMSLRPKGDSTWYEVREV